MKRQLNHELEGLLFTMLDPRANFTRDICEMVKQTYGEKVRVFQSTIPRSVRAEECAAEGISIFSYDLHGKIACAYQSLTEEVLSNE